MKIYAEKSIINFEFWSGAADNANMLTYEELERVEMELEQIYHEGIDETQLNDIFWFDFEWVVRDILGYEIDKNWNIIRD